MSRVESVERGAVRVPLAKRLGELLHQDGLNGVWLLLAFLLAALLIAMRCPSMFGHAQFYAEDGADWYADAYNYGWLHSLSIPYMGYLVTVQRIGAGLAMLLPFRWAPLALAFTGLFLQALPVPVLLSSRCRRWGPLPTRIAFAVVYIAIPNAHEIHVVCTNAQWHLAVVLAMLAFAAPPEGLAGKVFDVAVVLLGALTGPFVIVLLPLVALFWYVRRQRWTFVLLGILGGGAVAQLISLLFHSSQRTRGQLGASPALFIRILGGNGFIGALLGSHTFGRTLPLICSVCMLLVGIALCFYCAKWLSLEIRLFFVYCFLVFAAGLRAPAIQTNHRLIWPLLLQIPSQRYLFLPSLAFLFAVLWCAGFARSRVARWTGLGLTAVLCVGICADWRIPPMLWYNMARASEILREAKPGEHVVLPINPQPWFMVLVKK